MKNFLLVCLGMITMVTLVMGKMHWDEQMNSVLASANEEGVKGEHSVKNHEGAEDEEKDGERRLMMDKLNFLPTELRSIFKEKVESNEQVHLMVMGSSSTSQQEGAWPSRLKKKVVDTYGEALVKVSVHEISDKTSQQLIEGNIHEKFAKMKPDILLLEPFLLYDNGEIKISDRLKNLSIILNEFKEQNPEIKVILQPANPIYGAQYYPQEAGDLENYANQNKYIYLNHWTAWPDHKNEELQKYLIDTNLPNEKGNEVWANFLMNYFVQEVGG
jgi:hypothetical protein